MSQTVLVTGATGLLGRQVAKAFKDAEWKVTGTGHTRASPPETIKLDILNAEAVGETLDQVEPQVVVHCAAERSPDVCSNDPAAARALNVRATRNLASLTKERSIFLIYISTDYVFSGTEGEAPYEVDATPAPPNEYGQTKLDGERAVLEATKDTGLGISLRIPVLYGSVEGGKNSESAINILLDTLWKSQDVKEPIKMDDWAQRYPTNTEDVARVCKDVATKYLNTTTEERRQLPKILQFSSEDRMTKYEICKLLAEVMGLPMDGLVPNKDGNDPKPATQRPYNTHLSTSELKKHGIDVHTIDFTAWWRREVRAFKK